MKTLDDLIFAMRGFQESRALLTAVELDVFNAIGKSATASEVALTIGTDPRATEMLLNALVAVEALKKKNGVFHTTAASRQLASARAGLMHTVNMWNSWSTLTAAVRAGTAVRTPGVEARESDWTRAFIAAMHRGAAANAKAMVRAAGRAPIRRLLDVGGGSAAYSISFARAHPKLHAAVLDLPQVLPIAESHIREARLQARVKTLAGDLTKDEFGAGFDLVLLSSICHMLGEDENLDLLRRCARALVLGGRILIRDFILEPDRTAPRFAAIFALNMLVATRKGNSYSEAEYSSWLEAAGFTNITRPILTGDFLLAIRR